MYGLLTYLRQTFYNNTYFFYDIKRQFKDLECTLLLSLRDEIYDKKWEYHNVGNTVVDKPELHSSSMVFQVKIQN